jgi:RimJ/RimL family protein N-acetyltransferase
MIAELRTDRLLLRRARASDLDDLHAVFVDPRAMRYWSTPPHADPDETRRWLASMIDPDPAIMDDFVIEKDGVVIGKAGAWRVPEIGFILRSDHWGQGLAKEALSAVIAHLFATRPLDALTADVDPRNAPSLGLLHRLGFTETGRAPRTWLVGEEWCDSVYLENRRPDFQILTRDAGEVARR